MHRRGVLLNLDALKTGDIIFSTTAGATSKAIKTATASAFSHACVYFSDGIVIESSGEGVKPRRVSITGMNQAGGLLGLPHDDWESVTVLRHPRYPESDWAREVTQTLGDHVGLDYPPLSEVTKGAPWLARIFSYPVFKLFELVQWLRNREALAYEAWCSKLVGYVLAARFGHQLDSEEQAILANASPQQLFVLARELGYELVPDGVAERVSFAEDDFDKARAAYLPLQDATFVQWKHQADQTRAKMIQEVQVKSSRLSAKLQLATVLVLVASVLGYVWFFLIPRDAWQQARNIDSVKPGLTREFVRNRLGTPGITKDQAGFAGSSIQYERYGGNIEQGHPGELQLLYRDGLLLGYVIRNFTGSKLTKPVPTGDGDDWIFGKGSFAELGSDAMETQPKRDEGDSICWIEKFYFGNPAQFNDYYVASGVTDKGYSSTRPRSNVPRSLLVVNTDALCDPDDLDEKRKACQEAVWNLVCSYGSASVWEQGHN